MTVNNNEKFVLISRTIKFHLAIKIKLLQGLLDILILPSERAYISSILIYFGPIRVYDQTLLSRRPVRVEISESGVTYN